MSRIPSTEDLETLLVRSHALSATQLAFAKREAEVRQRRLAPMIIELGIVNERRFAEWMSQMTSIPVVDPITAAAVEPLVGRLPRALARKYEVVPLTMDPGRLTIATMNPLDPGCLDELHAATGMNIRPVIALHSAIIALLARFYTDEKTEPAATPAFDPSNTIPTPKEDDSLGSTTRAISPAAPKPETQLDRIEGAVAELRRIVNSMQERIEAIEESLEHILSRR